MVLRGRLGTLQTIGPGDSILLNWGYKASWTSREDIQSHGGNGGYWLGNVDGDSAQVDNPATRGYCIY